MSILQYMCTGKKEKEKKRSHKDRHADLSEEDDVSGSESSREKADLDQLLTRTAPRYVLSCLKNHKLSMWQQFQSSQKPTLYFLPGLLTIQNESTNASPLYARTTLLQVRAHTETKTRSVSWTARFLISAGGGVAQAPEAMRLALSFSQQMNKVLS